MTSRRLIQLLTPCSEGGLLANIQAQIDDFNNYIIWNDDIPVPVPGILASYDQQFAKVEAIKQEMSNYLKELKVSTGISEMIFVNSKFEYEIEIPSKFVEGKKLPPNFEFTS